jgi:hypothetical protein
MLEERRAKKPRTLLKGYVLLLSGLSDDEILSQGLAEKELGKVKLFHEKITSGYQMLAICAATGIDTTIGKRMWMLYFDFKKGKKLPYVNKPLRVITAFKILLCGCGNEELEMRGFNEIEIAKATEFLAITRDHLHERMLSQSMADMMELPRSTVMNMLKLYRQNAEGDSRGSKEDHRHYPNEEKYQNTVT